MEAVRPCEGKAAQPDLAGQGHNSGGQGRNVWADGEAANDAGTDTKRLAGGVARNPRSRDGSTLVLARQLKRATHGAPGHHPRSRSSAAALLGTELEVS